MQLCEFIESEAGSITDAWVAEVRQLPAEQRLARPALVDHLPELLKELSDWLASGSERAADIFERFARDHALQRLGHGIELHHLTTEYRLLRHVVLRLSSAAGVDVGTRDLIRFNDAIDHAVGLAVERYLRARDQAREQFINIMAHDLRTPLGTISMAASMLARSEDLDAKCVAMSERILRNADRMARMVSSLLDLARTRLGSGVRVAPQLVDFGLVVTRVVEELSSLHPSRALRFELEGELRGHWDPDLALQALMNLVVNAIEHGEDPIVVTARGEGNAVVIGVQNQGPPIPGDLLGQLFDPYVRGDLKNRASDRGAGLGLGLYITSEIVRAHGGQVDARSSLEEGTVFSMRWPRAQLG